MIQLGSTNSGDHPDVGAGVLEPGREWRDEILDKVGDTERAEAAEREAADGGVLIAAVPLEEVDCEQREVRVRARVGADVEVAHLLGDDVGGGGAEHHLPERGRHVDAGRHAGDHPLEDVAALVVRIGRAASRELPQLLLQIGHLALPALNRVASWRVSLGFERGGGEFREPEREKAAHPEGWEGDADFAAEGTVGAMAELGRGGRLDLASLGEEDDCDEPWCFVWI